MHGLPKGITRLLLLFGAGSFSFYFFKILSVKLLTSVEYFRWTNSFANEGIRNMAVFYLVSLVLGGLFADKYLSHKRSIYYGGFLIIISHLLFFFNISWSFFASIVTFFLGSALMKPSILAEIGKQYKDKGNFRESGFLLNILVSLGFIFATPFLADFVYSNFGFRAGFIFPIIFILPLTIYYKLSESFQPDQNLWKKEKEEKYTLRLSPVNSLIKFTSLFAITLILCLSTNYLIWSLPEQTFSISVFSGHINNPNVLVGIIQFITGIGLYLYLVRTRDGRNQIKRAFYILTFTLAGIFILLLFRFILPGDYSIVPLLSIFIPGIFVIFLYPIIYNLVFQISRTNYLATFMGLILSTEAIFGFFPGVKLPLLINESPLIGFLLTAVIIGIVVLGIYLKRKNIEFALGAGNSLEKL